MATPTDVPRYGADDEREEGSGRVATDAPEHDAPDVQDTADVQDAVAVPDTPAAAGGPARGRGLIGEPRLAWAVAFVAVVAAVLLGIDALQLRGREAARAEALQLAEVVAAQITTFDGATIEEWVVDVQALATDDFAAEVTGLFDQSFRDVLRDGDVRSVGEIQASFLQELDGDDATAFVLARQTSTNSARQEPVVDELRIEIILERVDGAWLAEEVSVLGPSGLGGAGAQGQAAPLAPAPPEPTGEGDD